MRRSPLVRVERMASAERRWRFWGLYWWFLPSSFIFLYTLLYSRFMFITPSMRLFSSPTGALTAAILAAQGVM